ncbi:MAG: aminotransferase class III-fold pyridoxal phosphate-dependent enzyme [Candidatus Omnitrophica bacterium]|nr:aminotransferase class III-fold pyridoxal phosphate-dependent enzyme [Candidatus Omnitrophota bacterium]
MEKDSCQNLYRQAKKIIPGGTQLLSKRPEMFLPGGWPAYYKKAKGCRIWDLDDNEYLDCSLMGIGSCILGYADSDINKTVKAVIDHGNMSTLNASEEVELSELLLELHPWAQMVRFARTGGEAMAIAVRTARASTGRDIVLFCGYHGWHDWYISANLGNDKSLDGHLLPGLDPAGVPRALEGTSHPFKYNDSEKLLELVDRYKGKIAAVVLETVRNVFPDKDFYKIIRKTTKDIGAVFILDEITSGWRLNCGGAHLLFGWQPDIAVFAKAISNGFPMATIIGKEKIMNSLQSTFVSSTYWTERIGPAAALATIRKIKEKNVPAHLEKIGKRVQKGWRNLAKKNNLKIRVFGIYPLGHFSFEYEDSLILKTLFIQEMLRQQVLATTAFYVSYAHKNKDINLYLAACDQAFGTIAEAIKSGDPEKYLKYPVCHSGFKRLA